VAMDTDTDGTSATATASAEAGSHIDAQQANKSTGDGKASVKTGGKTGVKRRMRPSGKQRKLAKLLVEAPELSGAQAMIRAGYGIGSTAHPGATIDRATTQQALAEARASMRGVMAERYSMERAADLLVDIADNSGVDFARIQAVDRCLEHLGVTRNEDRNAIYAQVCAFVAGEISMGLKVILTPDQLPAFADLCDRLSAKFCSGGAVIDVTPR